MKMKTVTIIVCVPFMLLVGCSQPTEQTVTDQLSDRRQSAADSTGMSVGAADTAQPDEPVEIVFGDQFPEVIAVKATHASADNWRFDVTLSSTYDSPQRYADGWRVLDAQDNELGVRVLGHDHANEQPFTRSHTIQIPNGNAGDVVFVEARDQANGWSGQRYEFKLP